MKLEAGVFLSSVAGVSILSGFGYALSTAKKSDPTHFDQGLSPFDAKQVRMAESGSSLAARALGWGTLLAFTGVAAISYATWKIMGVHNMVEFRNKVGSFLPRLTKEDTAIGRTQFDNLSDLVHYIIDEDEKCRRKKNGTE